MTVREQLSLGIALDGAGAHPAAPGGAPPPEEFVRLVRRAEAALLDFVTAEDGPGRLDSTVLLAAAAGSTSRIGLVPLGPVAGAPSAYAAQIATLDRISGGRAGIRPRLATSAADHDALVQLIGTPEGHRRIAGLFDAAAEFLGEVEEEWDSAAERVRAPQGRPPVLALAHDTVPYRFAARRADVVFVTPGDLQGLRLIREQVGRLAREAGRKPDSPLVFADLNVILADTPEQATERRERLDAAAGAPFTSDAEIFTGTPQGLADLLEEWSGEGGADGFRIRPAVLPDDLYAVVDRTAPELVRRGLLRSTYATRTLRGHLGLTDTP
ncbi:LLM class flavin-dependent oxidoreductase [Streptomyces sp. NPDC051662]|uniref:LLM class flavin-dependent oxidoreductase n=1 Tax=Streptomyces sp. NPDC051662 TaxID=3154750 RepID=UPI00342F5FE1